ncbi:pro-Pol polyprotein [Trichonephila clavipes]|nr:pro-Pol polyprotein [Trichonephila clavipes]
MNQGVLNWYSPHAEFEEAKLVVLTHEREKILKLHPDALTAAHYGPDGTFSRISSKYYWTAKRFESIAIDLFGPLPETTEGVKWIFIVDEYATEWVELFPLKQATAKECVITLLNKVFLRYVVPRRLISDNGTQFKAAAIDVPGNKVFFQILLSVSPVNNVRCLSPSQFSRNLRQPSVIESYLCE